MRFTQVCDFDLIPGQDVMPRAVSCQPRTCMVAARWSGVWEWFAGRRFGIVVNENEKDASIAGYGMRRTYFQRIDAHRAICHHWSGTTDRKGDTRMRSQTRVWGLLSLIVFFSSTCHGATITGTVRGADGTPF